MKSSVNQKITVTFEFDNVVEMDDVYFALNSALVHLYEKKDNLISEGYVKCNEKNIDILERLVSSFNSKSLNA